MQRLRSIEFYRDKHYRLVVIEHIELGSYKYDRACQTIVSLSPLAIVVCHADGKELILVDVGGASLDVLKQCHPELEDLIEQACASD